MAGFVKGLLLGAITGTAVVLLTSKKSGQEHRAELQATIDGTTADIKDFSAALAKTKAAAVKLQAAIPEHLEPALAGIEEATTHFNFRIAPHVAKIEDSLERINAALPQDTPDKPAETPTTPTPAAK